MAVPTREQLMGMSTAEWARAVLNVELQPYQREFMDALQRGIGQLVVNWERRISPSTVFIATPVGPCPWCGQGTADTSTPEAWVPRLTTGRQPR